MIRKNILLFFHEVVVGTFAVPWIEAVIANHGKPFFGERALLLENLVEILVTFLIYMRLEG